MISSGCELAQQRVELGVRIARRAQRIDPAEVDATRHAGEIALQQADRARLTGELVDEVELGLGGPAAGVFGFHGVPRACCDVVKAVYATHSKDLALSMGAMRTAKVSAFGNRKTFQQNVVAGWADEKAFVYLHYLDSKNFKHNYGGEWISTKKAKPVKVEKFKVADLKHLWRKSNKKELKEYLKDREAWRAPK